MIEQPSGQASSKPRSFRDRHRLPAEWVTFLLSLAIVALIVGLIVHSWRVGDDTPPVLKISSSVAEIRAIDGQYYVPFSIANTGGRTAESVQVIGEIRTAGEVEETGDISIDFLARNEKEEGAFVFSRDPRQAELSIRVASYKLP
jgi:uncharacterized protein (TIGR02588 family)